MLHRGAAHPSGCSAPSCCPCRRREQLLDGRIDRPRCPAQRRRPGVAKPAGSSRSSAVGSRSGCAQTASRPSGPRSSAEGPPQRGGLAQPAWPQLEPDQRGEGVLGRPAGGPAPAYGLAHRVGVRQVAAGGGVGHLLDPALDQGEQRLQPGQGGLLGRRVVRLEQALGSAPAGSRPGRCRRPRASPTRWRRSRSGCRGRRPRPRRAAAGRARARGRTAGPGPTRAGPR